MENIIVLQGVGRCPHCAIATPLLAKMWKGRTPSSLGNVREWGAYACVNCGGLVCARSEEGNPLYELHPDFVMPEAKNAHEDIPEIPRKFLQQALDTLHAPDAAAVMAGSAVDGMLKHLGYQEGSVYSRIDKALADNVLTKGMADWAHAVRLGSNRPRHADAEKPHVTRGEATQAVEFAESLGNFLFVLTAKIDRGIAAAENAEAAA